MLTLSLLTGLALASPPRPCATPWLRERFPAPRIQVPRIPPAAPVKEERDSFEAVHAHSSENFVIRWGTSQVVPSEQVEAMLTALERAWTMEVVEMDHPVPVGSDLYRFNVYVADTGVEGPWGPIGDFGAAGWFYPDDGEGYPFMVLSMETMADLEAGGLTAAHELYHAIQSATGRFTEEIGTWFWEATATWIEAEVFPESTAYARFLYGYALLPHLPIDYYAPFESGSLDEYHAYGAFLFPRMLSEHVASASLVRDAWADPELDSADPLESLESGLDALGLDLWDVFGQFSTRNVGWEYTHGEAYAAHLADLPIEFESKSHRFTESHRGRGTTGWDRVPTDLLPGSLGTNLLRLDEPIGEQLHVRVQPDRSEVFQGSVVMESSEGFFTHPLEQGQGFLELNLDLDGSETAAVLVLTSIDRDAETDERFGYLYQLSTEPLEGAPVLDSGEAGARSCGCSTSASGRGWGWVGLFGLIALRARRR